MSEKDLNQTELQQEQEAAVEQPAAPSIFDKPQRIEKKVRKKWNKGLVAAVAVVLVAAIAVGTVMTTRYLDKTDPANNSSNTSSTSSSFELTLLDYSGYLDTLDEVKELGRGGVEKIVLNNAEGELTFKQIMNQVKTTDENGKTTVKDTVAWLIDGYNGINWDDDSVLGLVGNALKVTAIMQIEAEAKDLASYGLADGEEKATIRVEFKDKTSYTVHVGNWSADKSGRYIRLDDSKDVYLSGYTLGDYAGREMKNFVSVEALGAYESTGTDSDYFSDGTLMFFDAILMGGRHFGDILLEFYPSDQTVTYTYYKLSTWQLNGKGNQVKSFEMPTNDDRVSSVFSMIVNGFSAKDIYGFYPDKQMLDEYGLDVTLFDIIYKINGVNYRIQIGDKQEDGLYPVRLNETPVIYACEGSVFPFLNYSNTDYYRNQLYLCNIDEIQSVRVQRGDLDATFVLTHTVKKDNEEDKDQTAALSNGKSVDIALFRTFLGEFMKTQPINYLDNAFESLGKADMTITITYVDKKLSKDVITMTKYSDRRYVYRTNGGGDVLIKSDTVEQIYQQALAAYRSAK